MPKFTENVVVHGDNGPTFFEAGAEVPAWALARVGLHVTDADTDAPFAEDEAEDHDDANPTVNDGPDFTAPATRSSRQRRK